MTACESYLLISIEYGEATIFNLLWCDCLHHCIWVIFVDMNYVCWSKYVQFTLIWLPTWLHMRHSSRYELSMEKHKCSSHSDLTSHITAYESYQVIWIKYGEAKMLILQWCDCPHDNMRVISVGRSKYVHLLWCDCPHDCMWVISVDMN